MQLEGTLQQLQNAANTPNAVPSTTSKTWTNPRKRPHHESTSLFEPISNDDALREGNYGNELHDSKRSRAAEWPLKNTDYTADSRKQGERNDKRSSSTSIRPGKFLEGSMNDKISQKPPSLYTRDEQAMEEYANMNGNGDREMNMDVDMTYDAGIESHKPSGMFRFGKAIANAFKPLTAWQGRFKEKEKEKEISTSPERNILQERQAKAADAYAELKKSGFKGTQAYRGVDDPPAIKVEDMEKQKSPFRDSGIDMSGEGSSEWTPNDQLIDFTDALLVPPPPQKARASSALSEASSARKTTHHLRKPSLQGLKKAASQIHLSPVKKSSETPPVPSIKVESASEHALLSPPGLGLRREPSKRDIAKQYKLSKKVSDLENKLETARRQLELSVSNAPPVPDLPPHVGRKPFRPGTLPSLPSERNMTPLKDTPAPPPPMMKGELLGEILQSLPPRRSSARLIQDSNPFTPMTRTEGVRDLEGRRNSTEVARPRTSRGIKAQTPTGVHKRLPRIPSKALNNSPLTYAENVPSFPKASKSIPPSNDIPSAPAASKVTDHTSVAHNHRLPPTFVGRPTTPSTIPTQSKKLNRGISPPPPSLASAKKANIALENSATPMEGIEPSSSAVAAAHPPVSKAPSNTKRGISPPPPSLASAKKPTILSDETATPAKVPGSSGFPHIDQSGPLQTISLQALNGDPIKKATAVKGQISPGTQKEAFEWGDDVF